MKFPYQLILSLVLFIWCCSPNSVTGNDNDEDDQKRPQFIDSLFEIPQSTINSFKFNFHIENDSGASLTHDSKLDVQIGDSQVEVKLYSSNIGKHSYNLLLHYADSIVDTFMVEFEMRDSLIGNFMPIEKGNRWEYLEIDAPTGKSSIYDTATYSYTTITIEDVNGTAVTVKVVDSSQNYLKEWKVTDTIHTFKDHEELSSSSISYYELFTNKLFRSSKYNYIDLEPTKMDGRSFYKHEEYDKEDHDETWIGDYYVQDYGLVFSYSSFTDIQFSSTTYRLLTKFNDTEIDLSFLKDDQRYSSAKYHMP